MKRLFSVVAVVACLLPAVLQAQLTYYYSVDIGSEHEVSNGGTLDPGDVFNLAMTVKDDAMIFGVDPAPPLPYPVPIGFEYEEGIETNFFDLDGEDQLDEFIEVLDGPYAGVPGAGLILNPDNIIYSVDDDGAPGWYRSTGLGYLTGDVPVSAPPDNGSDMRELMSAKGWFTWLPNPGVPVSTETALGLGTDPGPQLVDDDVDALDLERRRYWYWSSDHEATYGTDPGDIYVTDTTGAGGTQLAIDNLLIGVPQGTDIDAFELIVTDDPAILGVLGVMPGTYVALLFSVDQNDPITLQTDESGGLNPDTIYISLLTGAYVPLSSREQDGDVDAITVYEEVEPEGKWVQWPDLSEDGVDVNCTYDDGGVGPTYLLADDFPCTNRGIITNITVWGSWLGDILPDGNPSNVIFSLSIHGDIPTNGLGYSQPSETLWLRSFVPGTFEVTRYNAIPDGLDEGWLDPPTAGGYHADSNCWMYTFPIDPTEAFMQTGTVENPMVYWLDVQAEPQEPAGGGAMFGWKTTTNHWNDDACWVDEKEPFEGLWNELVYPTWHQKEGQSMDLAFRIETGPAIDFGDAPDTYGTTLVANGARHVIDGPWIGPFDDDPDAESDGQPDNNAQGDDNVERDDEDGAWIATGTTLMRGIATNFNVDVSGGGGVLQVWIDWNTNGVFEVIEEIPAMALSDGFHQPTLTPPTNASSGKSFARCRISTLGGLSATGPAPDGEVEDHQVNLDNGFVDWGNTQWPYAITTTVGLATETIYGRVRQDGVTPGAGRGAGITAELGYGPDGSDPENNSAWSWISTAYNPGHTSSNDEYMASLTIMTPGTYDYAYRYTRSGLDWTYGDLPPLGSDDGYAASNAGHIVIQPASDAYDFGDAPQPFPTLLANSGTRHLIGGILLGSNVDGEADGVPSTGATGDDINGTDDEDGVFFLTDAIRGDTVTVAIVTLTPGGLLNTWIDFNGNSDWSDASEHVISDVPLTNTGTNITKIPVPVSAAIGPVYSRFRYASATGLSYTGDASDGEVEDHVFTVYQGYASTNVLITNVAAVATSSTATVWWNAESGVIYQMQLVTNLSTNTPSDWVDVADPVVGPTGSQSDTNATDANRFYRIVVPYAAP